MGAQLKNTSGRGCAWYAGQNHYYSGFLSDIGQAFPLIQGIDARFVLADKAHSAHRFREQLKENDVQAVIPPIQRGNRSLIEYDKYLYKMRHIIENTFLSFKQ